MNAFVRVTIIVVGVMLIGEAIAKDDIIRIDQIPQLREEIQQQTVSQRVNAHLTRYHYCHFNLDAAFAGRMFDRYLNMLDYGHNVLLASDIAPFKAKKSQLADELKSGKLNLPFAMYNLVEKRRFERYQYALAQLNKPIDFTDNCIIEIDRSKAIWPNTNTELNVLWDAKVKSDALNLKLLGKEEKEIRDILTRRYQFAIRRLAQSKSEDVFQLIMNAFAHEIDPHTHYLSPRNTEQFNTEMSLSFEGIGAVLHMEDDYAVINSLVPGGPAAKSKIITIGDRVVGVGQIGKPMIDVTGWRLDDVVSLIKGPKGSKVNLEVLPSGKGNITHIVTVVRERIRLEDQAVKISVKAIGKVKVGILYIPGFYVGLTNDVKRQLKNLEKQNVQSVIIDLRANGGGALTEAVSLSGLFIPSGPIVQVRNRNGTIREDRDNSRIIYYKGPLVVLVDRFSASASEIFAAAMQDYGRALLVGEPTFGKGTVQQYRSLNRISDHMLHPEWPILGSIQYTVQKFYRVTGGSTQRKGVVPDIIMPTGIDTVKIGEKFEDNALPWDSINAVNYTKTGDLRPCFTKLLKAHQDRIAKDPEFQYIQQDIVRFRTFNDERNFVCLNFDHLEKKRHEDEAIRLQRINERLKRQGKKKVGDLKSIPKDYKDPDPYLNEAVYIALDLAQALSI